MTRRQRPIATRATGTVTNRSTGSPGCSIATRTQSHTATAETRRIFVTHLIEDGVDPLFVQQQVGHSWASTTAVYTTVGTDAKNRMLAAALGRAFDADPAGGTAR
jgi:site-specific recombinase XerD